MARQNRGHYVWILLSLISFAIAVLAGLGVILAKNTNGRIFYGALWAAVGASWALRFVVVRKKTDSGDEL